MLVIPSFSNKMTVNQAVLTQLTCSPAASADYFYEITPLEGSKATTGLTVCAISVL